MRKPALYGLALLCLSLLLALSGPMAHKLAYGGEAVRDLTPVSKSVVSIDTCDLHSTATENGARLTDSQQFTSASTPSSCVPASDCCKICSKGKACGNTCIRRDYTCHVGRGCACDQDEVCSG
jgi:hypothetical protein